MAYSYIAQDIVVPQTFKFQDCNELILNEWIVCFTTSVQVMSYRPCYRISLGHMINQHQALASTMVIYSGLSLGADGSGELR
jgi:hypothetical protein